MIIRPSLVETTRTTLRYCIGVTMISACPGVTTRRCLGNGESTVGFFDDMAPVCDPGESSIIIIN